MSERREIQREEVFKRASQENPCYFGDERAQYFSNLWFSQRETATIDQKDKVGLIFISKVLELGDEIAQRFAQTDHSAYRLVGEKQAAIPIDTDPSDFWQEVRVIFPGVYTDEDVNFLIKRGGIDAILHLLWQLETPLSEKSSILRSLAINAHAYK